MNTIYRKGDTVYHYSQGNIKGTVLSTYCISLNNVTPIAVQFQNGNYMYFKNGGSLLDDIMPSLSFTPYTLEGFSHERPKPGIEKGQIVYVRNDEYDLWNIAIAVRLLDNGIRVKNGLGGHTDFAEYSIDNPLKESI